ncbi:MAG: TonB-dependent siderophore receptor [Bryobacteraceae bacterium]
MARKRESGKQDGALSRPRYWITVGTLAAYSAAGSGKVALAQSGNTSDPTRRSGTRVEALPVRRYELASGPLSAVLKDFERATQIKVVVPTTELLAISSPGVSGVYTVEEALRRILANTGLTYEFNKDGTVAVKLSSVVTSVDVSGVAPTLSASMPKYQGETLNTAQTISVVPRETMQQQGTTTLRDALRNVAGISLAAGEGGAQGDNLTIRGFTARNDLFIDGMRDFGSYYRDPFNTQEVEVLQGPSSVTFGRGSTGGVVNQATKTPGLDQFISADLQFGTDATRRAALDWSAPLPRLGKGTAFRLNAMGNIGDVAGRNMAKNRRTGVAPSLAFGLGSATRTTLSYLHQNEDNTPDYGLPWLFNQPAPVNRNNYYGFPGNFLRTYADIGTAKVEHDVNEHLTLRNQVRYANYSRAVLVTEPRLSGIRPTTPLDSVQATRGQISARSNETFLDEQLDGVAHFKKLGIRHTLVTGVEGLRETSDPTRATYPAPSTSLLNPVYSGALGAPTITSVVADTAVGFGAYVLDTANIGRHIEASGGVRYDRFDNTYRQMVGGISNFARLDQRPTWRAALVYKPVGNGSIYFDAGTSFNPSAESLSLTAGSANIPPETNKTYEVGTKWEFNSGRLQVNSSWFRTVKENARESDPTNSLLVVLAGTQKVSGVQASVKGRITSRWEILSSYAYLDSRVVASRYYPGSVGYPLANVPRNTFNLWSTHRLPMRFEGGIGANYVSSRNASSTVPLDATTGLVKAAPSYWVFNAMLTHPLNEHVDLQLNGYNLANRFYYDQLHPAHIIPGPGRSLLVGFRFKF